MGLVGRGENQVSITEVAYLTESVSDIKDHASDHGSAYANTTPFIRTSSPAGKAEVDSCAAEVDRQQQWKYESPPTSSSGYSSNRPRSDGSSYRPTPPPRQNRLSSTPNYGYDSGAVSPPTQSYSEPSTPSCDNKPIEASKLSSGPSSFFGQNYLIPQRRLETLPEASISASASTTRDSTPVAKERKSRTIDTMPVQTDTNSAATAGIPATSEVLPPTADTGSIRPVEERLEFTELRSDKEVQPKEVS